jgi:transcriptional regulator with XRE-family HTH domain
MRHHPAPKGTTYRNYNTYSIYHAANNINGLWKIDFDIYRLYIRSEVVTMSEIAKTIGQRIRSYRLQLGLSQEKIAELSGCHPTYIGQVERGEKNATLESIEKIAAAIQVPLSKLFDKMGNSPDESADIPAKCYELLLAKSKSEQEQIYRIILELDKYKDIHM